MTVYAYDLKTPAALLTKAISEVNEIAQLQEHVLSEADRTKLSGMATNVPVTLSHIVDAVFQSDLPEFAQMRTRLNISTFDQMRDYVENTSPRIKLCRELANGYKHARQKQSAKVEETTISVAAAFTVLNASLIKPPAPQGRAARPKIIIKATGERLRAVDVFKTAIEEWRRFFAAQNLPVR